MLMTLWRGAFSIWPWLAALLVGTLLTYATTSIAAGAATSSVCDARDDRMVVYAVTTHRVPRQAMPCGGVDQPAGGTGWSIVK